MDASPHTGWVDCWDATTVAGVECQAYCTCGWQTIQRVARRVEADRLLELHLRNARRRALRVPLGDLDDDIIRRVLHRMTTLMLTGTTAGDALTQAREDEADGQLGEQLVISREADLGSLDEAADA